MTNMDASANKGSIEKMRDEYKVKIKRQRREKEEIEIRSRYTSHSLFL